MQISNSEMQNSMGELQNTAREMQNNFKVDASGKPLKANQHENQHIPRK
jgi:hypothetical protein